MKKLIISTLLLSSVFMFAQRQKSIQTFEISNKYNQIVENYFENLLMNRSYGDLKDIPKYDRPDLAAEFEFIKTVDPSLGYVPVERLTKARNYAKDLLSEKAAIPNITWQERGPNNVGGRTRALMFDPNDSQYKKVWAGSVSGGLWYNLDITNSASTWTSIDNFWANIAVTCITFNPNNTNTFYVGTGEGWSTKMQRGAGIWKTTDGGQTWNQLASTDNSDFYYVQKIVITSSSRIIAATNAGLYISDDGGSSWTQKMINYFADIEISASGDIYASEGKYGDEGFIYKSTNNGTDWNDISPNTGTAERIELACAPSNSDVIYAVASNGTHVDWMKRSVDAGANWDSISVPEYQSQGCSNSGDDFTRGQAWYDLIMMVHPTNENYLLAGGIDIHRTTDGGASWESISYWTGACATYVHADQHAMVYRPNNSNEAIFGCDGGVFYSNDVGDNGNNFMSRNNDYNVTQFYACATKNEAASNYFLAGAQDNGTQKFTQAGVNTTTQATGGDGAFCFIDQDNPDIQITSYVYNNRYISTDGGNSFGTLTSESTGAFICPADYDSEANIFYSSLDNDQLLISDIGTGSYGNTQSIDSLGGSTASSIKVSPHTANTIFVGTYSGGIYKITDANTTANSVNIDINETLPNGYISCIDIAENENHLLITFSNYGITSVWETTNGGNTWVNKEGNLPDMPIRWCLFNPFDYNQALLATDVGIWSVDNLSASSPQWTPTVDGSANVRCDMIKYRDADDLVYVATYGRGLFTTDAFGDQQPIAQFETNSENVCLVDTIVFTDISTKNPDTWTWTFTPNTITFVNGTDENSQNPEVIFNNTGNYTVELYVSNATGNDNEIKSDYINVNNTCEYAMTNGSLYTCNAVFYDPGYTGNYPAGVDYTYTIFPDASNSNVKIQFNSFYIESATNCVYDYLEIYDAANSGSGFIGKYCGTDNPGIITATNTQGALTFVFHADGGVEEFGWEADITCEENVPTMTETVYNLNLKIYPNPAHNQLIISNEQLIIGNVEILDITGKIVKQLTINNEQLIIDISDLENGVYFLSVDNVNKKFIKI